MPYLSTTLGKARELVAAGELNAESVMGMEGWPGDARLEIFVPSKPLTQHASSALPVAPAEPAAAESSSPTDPV